MKKQRFQRRPTTGGGLHHTPHELASHSAGAPPQVLASCLPHAVVALRGPINSSSCCWSWCFLLARATVIMAHPQGHRWLSPGLPPPCPLCPVMHLHLTMLCLSDVASR